MALYSAVYQSGWKQAAVSAKGLTANTNNNAVHYWSGLCITGRYSQVVKSTFGAPKTEE